LGLKTKDDEAGDVDTTFFVLNAVSILEISLEYKLDLGLLKDRPYMTSFSSPLCPI
jgi:hypothetical protein